MTTPDPKPITDEQLAACEQEWRGDWEEDDMYDFERALVARIRADAEKLRIAEDALEAVFAACADNDCRSCALAAENSFAAIVDRIRADAEKLRVAEVALVEVTRQFADMSDSVGDIREEWFQCASEALAKIRGET